MLLYFHLDRKMFLLLLGAQCITRQSQDDLPPSNRARNAWNRLRFRANWYVFLFIYVGVGVGVGGWVDLRYGIRIVPKIIAALRQVHAILYP